MMSASHRPCNNAVVRRAPLVHDRQDLDELVPTGEAARRLGASNARVAIDGDGEDPGAWRSQHLPRVIPVASLGVGPPDDDHRYTNLGAGGKMFACGRAVVVVASGGTGVRIHHTRVLAVAAVLVGICASAPNTRFQAEQPVDELRALAEQGDAAVQFNLGANTQPARAFRSAMATRSAGCHHAEVVPRQPTSPVLQFASSREIHRDSSRSRFWPPSPSGVAVISHRPAERSERS